MIISPGICKYCLDKTKFGGPNIVKQACYHKQCHFLRTGGGRKKENKGNKERKEGGTVVGGGGIIMGGGKEWGKLGEKEREEKKKKGREMWGKEMEERERDFECEKCGWLWRGGGRGKRGVGEEMIFLHYLLCHREEALLGGGEKGGRGEKVGEEVSKNEEEKGRAKRRRKKRRKVGFR